MTGIDVTLNVLAEFIGGMIVEGNLSFANDLKIAHYVKIPRRVTFAGQMLATLISTLVCIGIMKFQMDIKDVCTSDAPMRFYCPGPNTFFTASVLWGTIGPIKVFGANGQYKWLLMGFPLSALIVACFWALKKLWPDSRPLRQVHVVAAISGALQWAPYSMGTSPHFAGSWMLTRLGFSYAFAAVPVAWFSWI